MSEPSLPSVTTVTSHAVSRRTPEPGADSRAQKGRQRLLPRQWIDAVAVGLVLLVACAFYVSCSGVPRLFDQIDGQYAGAAREMLARGDLLIPTQDGVPRLQKPPLVYWLEVISLRALGINEFAARLPVVLATLGWFAMTGLLAWRITGQKLSGALAALVLATFSATFFFTHLVMPEPFLALSVSLTIWSLCSAQEQAPFEDRRVAWWLTAAWFSMACGALTKGLHALVFPVLTYGLLAWVAPGHRRLYKRFLTFWPGWVLLAMVLVPWYAAVEARYPGFVTDHFWNEQVGHVFNRRWPADSNRVPLALFWVEHLGLLFPWTVFLPLILPAFAAGCGRWREHIERPLGFLWALFLVNALTISFSSIQDYYLLVSWPAFAVGIATNFVSWERRTQRLAAMISGATLAGLGGLAFVTREMLIHALAGHPAARGIGIETNLLDALAALPLRECHEFVHLLGVIAVALALGGCAVALCARWNRPALAAVATGLISLTFLACGAIGLRQTEDVFSCWNLADYLNRLGPESYEVASESESNDYTSLFFYLPHAVYWVNGHPDTEFVTRVHGIGRDLYWTSDQLIAAWKRDRPLFFITQKRNLPEWRERFAKAGGGVRVVQECGRRVLLTNQPAEAPEPFATGKTLAPSGGGRPQNGSEKPAGT
ncbi:MAG: glycosyltransferase family 39 protein [Verrucomicrobia bacterium]|nr:glycosyltransferase family 39 protein [Verrucomicrobiota bacterium]